MACKPTSSKCFNFAKSADKRIVIQEPTETVDDYGGQSVTWGAQSTVWAHIKSATGREVFQSEQLQSRVSHVFTIRYQSDLKDTSVTAKNRISFDGRFFQIRYVRNVSADMKSEGTKYQMIYADETKDGIE